MVVIVLHHCCVHSSLTTTLPALLFFALTIPAVDGFVAISGWYGIRFSWHKFLKLWGIIAFYSVLCYALHPKGWFIVSGGWFGGSYLALMLFTPLINAGIEALAHDKKRLISAWGLYALAITLKWIPTHLMTGVNAAGWGSHTLNTLLFVYVTVRVIRLLDWTWLMRQRLGWWLIGCAALLLASVPLKYFLWEMLGKSNLNCLGVLIGQGYDMPLVWITAILAFLFFYKLHVPTRLAKVAAFLGPSMFGIYLFHESAFGSQLYRIPMAYITEHWTGLPNAVNILLCVLITSTTSLGVDLLRRGGLALIKKLYRRLRIAS